MLVCPLRLAAPAALAALLVALGCGSDDSESASAGGGSGDSAGGDGGGDSAGGDGAGGGGVSPPTASACAVPEDCVAVAATCCECPTFAVSAGSEVASACEQVDCDPPPDGCPLVEPACVDFQCQLACTPVATGQVCANGFDRDSFGCLVDACRAPPGEVYACELDDDCVEAPADCCGCELGGAETSVAASALGGYLESLGCSGDPACPGVDVCDAGLVPRCIAQGCTLGPAGGGSPDDGGDGDGGDGSLPGGNLCGVPDFPPCPVGQACILNLPDGDDASRMGVGTCADL
ncbi:MAG TPA: hypothetical protein VKB80_27925 [Kofleriaceae bacterium]|nr:hypothetical protein [Kofleriaceae bacterium]